MNGHLIFNMDELSVFFDREIFSFRNMNSLRQCWFVFPFFGHPLIRKQEDGSTESHGTTFKE